MPYDVYAVIYKEQQTWAAVAVSASSGSAALARVRGNRPAETARAIKIKGRKPEYEQDRIEGTCDLRDPMKPAPHAGEPRAEEIRASNERIIRDWHTVAPTHRTAARLLELAAELNCKSE